MNQSGTLLSDARAEIERLRRALVEARTALRMAGWHHHANDIDKVLATSASQ